MSRRFMLRKIIFAIGNDLWVMDEQGNKVYLIDNKVIALRKTYIMYDMQHQEVLKIQREPLHLHKTFVIEHQGKEVAQIQKAWLTVLRDKWNIQVPGSEDLVAMGDLLDHEYHITRNNQTIADISKQWFTIRESYGVEVFDDTQAPLMIAIAVAIDEMVHEEQDAEHHEAKPPQ
jgi:uncharacterized protein YxjI